MQRSELNREHLALHCEAVPTVQKYYSTGTYAMPKGCALDDAETLWGRQEVACKL